MLGIRGATMGTKVGRRTLTLFVACAILPISALAVVAYREVQGTLIRESQKRLEDAAKREAQQIVERTAWLGEFLRQAAADSAIRDRDEALAPRYRAVWTQFGDGRREPADAPAILPSAMQRGHLVSGQPTVAQSRGPSPRLVVGVATRVHDEEAIVWGEPEPRFLWGFGESEEMSPAICVLNSEGATLSCSADHPPLDPTHWNGAADAVVGGEGRPTLASTRTVFMRHDYGVDDWMVVALEARSDALAPLASFGRTFALVAGLALLIVFFVSHVQIRRTTAPLEALYAATQRVASGDYDTRVAIQSRDEFDALAQSFTTMSREIGRQFVVLRGLDEVDRVALEGGDVRRLWSAARPRILAALPCPRQIFVVPNADTPNATWGGECAYGEGDDRTRRLVSSSASTIGSLCLSATSTMHAVSADSVADLAGDEALRWKWVSLPLWHAGRLHGVLLLGRDRPFEELGGQVVEARRLADRLAIALSNLHLVRRLDTLNIGTMTAFARAIDANSTWTAGHSERVCEVATSLGRELALGAAERDTLYRGSLLHDIGKIGIPPEILNKPGRLDPQEVLVVQSHPVLGARILEPVGAFDDIIPLVRHHHERLDGHGYPDGLRGPQIDLLTRVLSIADVYDALVSPRPYRDCMEPAAAVSLMREGADTQFDRHLLNVFIELHSQGTLRHIYQHDRRRDTTTSLAEAVGAGRELTQEAA